MGELNFEFKKTDKWRTVRETFKEEYEELAKGYDLDEDEYLRLSLAGRGQSTEDLLEWDRCRLVYAKLQEHFQERLEEKGLLKVHQTPPFYKYVYLMKIQ